MATRALGGGKAADCRCARRGAAGAQRPPVARRARLKRLLWTASVTPWMTPHASARLATAAPSRRRTPPAARGRLTCCWPTSVRRRAAALPPRRLSASPAGLPPFPHAAPVPCRKNHGRANSSARLTQSADADMGNLAPTRGSAGQPPRHPLLRHRRRQRTAAARGAGRRSLALHAAAEALGGAPNSSLACPQLLHLVPRQTAAPALKRALAHSPGRTTRAG